MQWFRWYHGTCADPKLGGVARKTAARRGDVIAVWAMVLESASESEERGRFAISADDIAEVIGCETASVAAILAEMESRGMLGAGRVAAFGKRNPVRDNVIERVRKHRARKAVTRGNADETITRVSVTASNATDVDGDTETDTEKDKNTPPTPPRRAADAARGVCVNADEADPEFEEAWSAYPRRGGGNSKSAARKAWVARRRAGVPASELREGVRRYAAYCAAREMIGGEFVKQAATFFGPDEHFREEWAVPPPKAAGAVGAEFNGARGGSGSGSGGKRERPTPQQFDYGDGTQSEDDVKWQT